MAGLMLVLAGLGLFVWLRLPTSSEEAAAAEGAGVTPLVAVLPLVNVSGEEQEYFADGMTEELITTLNKIEALPAIGRRSVMRFKGSDQPISEIARILGVTHVVDGSVLQGEDSVRITVNLYVAPSEVPLWGERFTRGTRDAMTLQREVALAIAREIKVQLTPEDEARLAKAQAVNPRAYEFYLLGRHYRWKENPQEAVRYLELAIAEDSTYAPAWAALAWPYFTGFIRGALTYDEAVIRVRTVAEKALGVLDEWKAQWDYGTGPSWIPYVMAEIYACLGETEKALDLLELKYERDGVIPFFVGVDPAFDLLRSEPRFQAVLEKMGLDG